MGESHINHRMYGHPMSSINILWVVEAIFVEGILLWKPNFDCFDF